MISADNDPYTALNTIIQPAANGRHSATVIMLHSLGDRSTNLQQAIRYLLGRNLFQMPNNQLHHIRVLLPSAPSQPIALLGGRVTNCWFDVPDKFLNYDVTPENISKFALSDRLLSELIDAEVAAGVPRERIAIVGYSMGGCMALHVGLRLRPGMAAVGGLSTFMKSQNAVFDCLRAADAQAKAALPPVLMCHGTDDAVMRYEWGRATFGELQRLGVRGEFRTLVGMRHEMRANELMELEQWLAERLPALSGDAVSKL